jgi:Protein of unknown function (DUF2997)
MKNEEIINVTLGPDGTVEIDAVNFKGGACEKATAFLEKALGMNTDRKKKPEYFQTESVTTKQQVG